MPNEAPRRLRCAIYTRKSSEEGLEQSFNSLDAQREACAAFILSQRHEGWTELSTHYDDGGFSGGSMNRPALAALMHDIDAGLIDSATWLSVEGLGPVNVSSDAGDRSVGTRMMARVVTEYTNAAGLPCRHVGPVLAMTAEPSGNGPSVGAAYRGPHWRWTRQIEIDDIEAKSADLLGATHYLYIEEREAYLPATYAKEPVSADVAAGLLASCDQTESGPRFAVRLPLRRPQPLANR